MTSPKTPSAPNAAGFAGQLAEPAPGDLQRVVDDLESQLRADPESLAVWRSVFAQLASEPFDPTGPVVS